MMMTSDPIADMLTRIRNANTAKHDTVDIPASKIKVAIAGILVDEGFIEKYDIVEDGKIKTIHVTLKYGADKNEKVITGLRRISKPGLRVYANSADLPRVLGGLGTAIISTNQGVVTDKKARELRSLLLTESSGAKEQALDATKSDIARYLHDVEYWSAFDESEVDGGLHYWKPYLRCLLCQIIL